MPVRFESRHNEAIIPQASRNAPKLARTFVIATAEPREICEVPAAPTESLTNFAPYQSKNKRCCKKDDRFNESAKRGSPGVPRYQVIAKPTAADKEGPG
jgi:hypothetical protein